MIVDASGDLHGCVTPNYFIYGAWPHVILGFTIRSPQVTNYRRTVQSS